MPLLHEKFDSKDGSEPYADISRGLLPSNSLPCVYAVGTNRTELRDLLNSELSGLKGCWSNVLWDHKATFKKAVLDGMANTNHNPYRRYNYRRCDWSHSVGFVHQSKENKTVYRERMSCGEKLCLRCDFNKRKRQAVKAVSEMKALFKGTPGAPGVMFITFTLPEAIEALPLQNPEIEKQLKNDIGKIIKELYGVKTRSNIGMRLAVHAIGSKDVMRDRWHCHAEIVPGEVIKKDGDFKFHWLKPAKRKDAGNPWKIDLKWLRDAWKSKLLALGGGDEVANPQVEFLKYSAKKEDQKKYWRKLTHKMSYNLRSFARDFENVFLRSDYESSRMILRGSRRSVGYWYDLTSYEVVDRFAYIRSKTLFRKRGFLSCMKKYEGAVKLEYPEDDPFDVCYAPVAADILSIYEREYNKELKKWLVVRKDIWHWICPVSGENKIMDSKEMVKWNQFKAGRKKLE